MTKRQIINGWQKITNTEITEDWATQATKNPDRYELKLLRIYQSYRTSLIPLHGKKSWGLLPSPLWKVLAWNLRKNSFTLVWKHILHVCQGYKDIWTRICFETIVIYFIAAQFWKYTKQIRNTLYTFFIKMHTECNEHHLN